MLSVEMKQEGLGHALDDKRLAVPIYQRSYALSTAGSAINKKDERWSTLFISRFPPFIWMASSP